ncbi:PREDICTED: kaempferol 3-O-beta-D-galactosyltransferase-like [Ipomoea nil]|uniref:kaempferol 3-O-beta-D-galactosyltransferase-like n=1 Tax=Ipomoea nil TaxID=35883 RepID=UPI00090198BC|nr:PREDICTED: kaempferol 3-O-beta-D-galactosyltransferase-like [Ipomoea nil]
MASTTSLVQRGHVAVLAFPFAAHPGLLFGLVRRLATAAPNATFTFFSTAKSNAKVFATTSEIPGNIERCDVPDGLPEGYVFAGNVEEEIGMFLKSAPENFKTAVAAADGKESGMRVGCVVADAFLWFSGEMAAEMGVSWVPVWTSGAASLLLHLYTDFIRETVGLQPGREEEIVTFIPGLSELRLGDMPSGIVTGNIDSPFAVMLHNMGRALQKTTIMPINSFEELDPPIINHLKTTFSNVLNIGPFNLTSPPPSSDNLDRHNCISWLDSQPPNSVAYLAFGTVATPPPNELNAIAEALEESKTPFLWSLGEKFTSHLPEGFLERTKGFGKIVPWTPQVKVLGHGSIGVFINHGGWNSVLESITAGVPIICRPFFGDHHLNCWMVERVWGIGVRVDGGGFTKNGTMDTLELVLSCDTGKALKRQVEVYKELVQRAVGPKGSSTQSFNTLLLKVISGENH